MQIALTTSNIVQAVVYAQIAIGLFNHYRALHRIKKFNVALETDDLVYGFFVSIFWPIPLFLKTIVFVTSSFMTLKPTWVWKARTLQTPSGETQIPFRYVFDYDIARRHVILKQDDDGKWCRGTNKED